MQHKNFSTKIFLDSGNPKETEQILSELGFLDGQTTNPTLIAKNPEVQKRLVDGLKFSADEVLRFYREVVETISGMMPAGSVSIEVYADKNTTARAMIEQGKKMFSWIPNAHIKLPITHAGLEAAEEMVKEGVRVNMTLCFSQSQAAAVHAATQGAQKGQVFVSPFIGRLDDIGENGMSLIENILRLYSSGDDHVEVLTASVRSREHFLRSLQIGSDISTAPYAILSEWSKEGAPMPKNDFKYDPPNFTAISYQTLDLDQPWQSFDLYHPLTDKGLERFAADWNALIM
ncbi:MAG: transaldolase [Parcubacteria group bacterium CG11_big_fil_rev_8_21_14_0_20_41_14]|nr:MAG: transaldolase [Parcubacteria group bacterium CG11_big_fil_rev_8_21_14_0_20_41_14]